MWRTCYIEERNQNQSNGMTICFLFQKSQSCFEMHLLHISVLRFARCSCWKMTVFRGWKRPGCQLLSPEGIKGRSSICRRRMGARRNWRVLPPWPCTWLATDNGWQWTGHWTFGSERVWNIKGKTTPWNPLDHKNKTRVSFITNLVWFYRVEKILEQH